MNNQIKEEGLTDAYLLGKYDGIKQGREDAIAEFKDLGKLYSEIRADAIDECISKIDTLEQISFGIVEVDLIRSLLEQLKEKI